MITKTAHELFKEAKILDGIPYHETLDTIHYSPTVDDAVKDVKRVARRKARAEPSKWRNALLGGGALGAGLGALIGAGAGGKRGAAAVGALGALSGLGAGGFAKLLDDSAIGEAQRVQEMSPDRLRSFVAAKYRKNKRSERVQDLAAKGMTLNELRNIHKEQASMRRLQELHRRNY